MDLVKNSAFAFCHHYASPFNSTSWPAITAVSSWLASKLNSVSANCCKDLSSSLSIFDLSFFSNPNRKNQRSPNLVATIVLAPELFPRPWSANRFFTTYPPRSASTRPLTISCVASKRSSWVTLFFRIHLAKVLIAKTCRFVVMKVLHLVKHLSRKFWVKHCFS